MATKRIERAEVTRYWEIFSSLVPDPSGVLQGSQGASVLKNSRLRDDQLEKIWDLADVDNDGGLDFPEFCVAMRLIYDLVNGEMADVPRSLPSWLVPQEKAHLIEASRGLATGHERAPELDLADDDGAVSGLRDDFDWSMTPQQRRDYDDIYTSVKDAHGYVTRAALAPFLDSIDVPDTDINSAWNLINPSQDEAVGKDATLYLLHVLRGRHDGFRIPRRAPGYLVHSFQERSIEYNIDHVRNSAAREMADDRTATGRKAKFGDAYLNRLGAGGDRGYAPRGTDFGDTPRGSAEWEEVRLKKKLAQLERKIADAEAYNSKRGGRRADSKPALVKRELEQMLDYKRRELRDLEMGEGRAKEGAGLKSAEDDVRTIREQVDGLDAHLKSRLELLEGLRAQVQAERAR